MIKPVSFENVDNRYNLKSTKKDTNTNSFQGESLSLSNSQVGRAILNRNNISFRNLSEPIEITDEYNKPIAGKDHLDLPNIHVYEYPDTNLQVFIDENDNESNQDQIIVKFNIENKKPEKSFLFLKKELCLRLLCNLINFDNDDCFVTTFDSDFFSVNYNLNKENYKQIGNINKLITAPQFKKEDLEQIKKELIADLQDNTKKNKEFDNIFKEINQITIDDINDYYFGKLKNSEAKLSVVINKDYYEANKNVIHKTLNENISNKFAKHGNINNSLKETINTKQAIFSNPNSDVYLEFQYPMAINNFKDKKIGDYLSRLMLLYRAPYVSTDSFPVEFKLDSELKSMIDNKPLMSYLRFKISPIGNEKIKNTEQAIEAFKGMLITVCENDLTANTLEELKALDKQDLELKFKNDTDVYKKALLLNEYGYDVFQMYEIIDSISLNDIKHTVAKYMIEQKPIIYVNENKNPFSREMKHE